MIFRFYNCLGFALGLLGLFVVVNAADELSDIERARQMHEKFWNKVVQQYPVESRTQANSRERVLTTLEIYNGRRAISGTTPIAIAADLAPHFRDFSYLEIEGEGLDQIESAAYRNAAGIVYTNPQLQSARYIQIPGGHYADWDSRMQTLVIEGDAVITGLRLVSLEGIVSTFDASSFVLAKSSLPPINANIRIDASRALSIDGVAELPAERFYRLYFSPGADRSGWESTFAEKGFYPGRQMLKLAHELETRHGTFKAPLLQEDPLREGYADLSIFEARDFSHYKGVSPDLQFAQCLNIWPSFMKLDVEGHKNVLGTPAVGNFAAAAELAAAYIADEIEDSGRTATYWEVKNESDIKHEWTYHEFAVADSWTRLGEFHNTVAASIKAVDPGILVGGPASAWPRMEMGGSGFMVWENHRHFMEVTRDNLDFYSHHFYDVGVNSSFEARADGYEDWLQGRLDCVLDMLCAEMRATDNVKPLLITEYGTLQGGVREIDYWLRVCNYSSFMMQFMERPADFELTVPFLLGYMHWEPASGHALLHKDANGAYQLTKNAYFLDLWEGVGGEYLHLDAIHPKVHALAWKKGTTLYLAVNNQSGADLNFQPQLQVPEGIQIDSIQYRHPTYRDGQFRFLRGSCLLGQNMKLPNAETMILEIRTDQEVKTKERIEARVFYADQTLIFPGSDISLAIALTDFDAKQLHSAKLRLGIQNADGPTGELRGQLNEFSFSLNLDQYKDIRNFFEYVEIVVPVNCLQERNQLTLDLPYTHTIVSHAQLKVMVGGGNRNP
jgi:agarase